jgi:hypothetical protein
LSATVTVAVQAAELPWPSLMVKVTVLAPMLLQVNELGETPSRFTVPQLSEEPLFTWAGPTLAVPALFKLTEIFWQTAVGAVASLTVTTAVQVAVLPWPSLAVSVTVFAPWLLQLNVLGDTLTAFTVPQLSLEDAPSSGFAQR